MITAAVNGLAVTPHRLRLLAAVRRPGDVYYEAGQWWHKPTGRCVTSAVGGMAGAGWVRSVPGPWPARAGAQVTDVGRAILHAAPPTSRPAPRSDQAGAA